MALKISFVCKNCNKKITGWLSHYDCGDIDNKLPKDEQPILIHMIGCESGGIYYMTVECPKCEYQHDIFD